MGLRARIFAALYDRMMAEAEKAGLSAQRQALLAGAAGRVLEIGGGTGGNLPFYGTAVTGLVVTEPEEQMARRLARKLAASRIAAQVTRAPAEQLPFQSGRFDCVVATLVLCTVADPARALAEVHRVLKPGGRLLFLEHVRSEDPRLARWQDRLRGVWSWAGCGCQPNRRTVDAIRAAGFSLTELRQERFAKAVALVRPLAIGTAARA